MRPSTFFKFALVAFAAAPTAYAYGADYDYVEARDIDVSDNMIHARALEAYYDSGAVTARDLGEAIDYVIVQRQLAGEDTQELEARLLSLIPKVISTGARLIGGAISSHHHKK
jgi:hypothetical protein